MTGQRIFIAADISEGARRAAAAYINELRGEFRDLRVGWEKPEKLHFTLKFLGDVDVDRVINIKNAVAAVALKHKPFAAVISGKGVFPNTREPRVLWLGLGKGRDEMVSLGTDVENKVGDVGFPKENRPFNPHLTIARIREARKGKDLAHIHINSTFPAVEFTVEGITVYESQLSSNGSTYRVLSTHGFLR